MNITEAQRRMEQAEQAGRDMQALVDSLTAIVAVMSQQLSLQRAMIWAMCSQAAMDEVSQDPVQNPWLGLKSEFAGKINPLVTALNKMMGIKVAPIPEGASKSVVVATEMPRR
jgi:streptogramin lyase